MPGHKNAGLQIQKDLLLFIIYFITGVIVKVITANVFLHCCETENETLLFPLVRALFSLRHAEEKCEGGVRLYVTAAVLKLLLT